MIKSLRTVLKMEKEHFEIPHSIQQFIPVRRIWPDGIFLVGNKFSRSWKFADINYSVASKEDQTEMFLGYSELLNALDTGATTKITINNRRVNRVEFDKSILLPEKGDGLNQYRYEYNRMLEDRAISANNNIVQEKYITISIMKKSIEEARTYFARVGADIAAHLSRLSSAATELDATDRLRILHDFFRIGEEVYFHFDLNETMRKGHSFKDYISPDSLELNKDYFVMGSKFGRVLFLREYASYIKDSMITELCELNRNMMLSIDIIPVPTDEAVREVQNRLLGVETNITNWQRKQNENNNFSAVVPYDMEQQRKESKEFLDDLTTRDQRMLFVLVTMVHVADTKEQLDSDTDSLLSVGRKHLCQLSTLNWQQADGLKTVILNDLADRKAKLTGNDLKRFADKASSHIKYQNITDSVTLDYIIQAERIKENITLTEYIPSFSISFDISTDNLTAKTLEGGITALCDGNNEVFYLMPSYALDSEDKDGRVDAVLESIAGGYRLTITPDDTWMKTAVYPVVIDPQIDVDWSASNVNDTYISSLYHNGIDNDGDNGPWYTYASLRIGYSDSYYNSYALIKYTDLPDLKSSEAVIGAYMISEREDDYTTTDHQFTIHNIIKDWNQTQVTWDNFIGSNPAAAYCLFRSIPTAIPPAFGRQFR